jgi:hypothetical protein
MEGCGPVASGLEVNDSPRQQVHQREVAHSLLLEWWYPGEGYGFAKG